jgi:hypothetical protein
LNFYFWHNFPHPLSHSLSALSSKKNGALGQEIVLQSARHLGAVLTRAVRIAHRSHIVRGFHVRGVRSNDSVLALTPTADACTVEWCRFSLCDLTAPGAAVLRLTGAADVLLRANSFQANLFGASPALLLRVMHVEAAPRVAVVGNLFADAANDAARSYDVVFEAVVAGGSFRQNAVAVGGFPAGAAALFSNSKGITIAGNFFRAALAFADPAPNVAGENHVVVDNTITAHDSAANAPLVRFEAGATTNVTFENNFLTNCGNVPWLRTTASTGSIAGSVMRNTTLLWGDPYCLDEELAAGSSLAVSDTLKIEDEQALAFEETSGCNGLPVLGTSRRRGASVNYLAMPFTECFSTPPLQLYPNPYPPTAVTTTTGLVLATTTTAPVTTVAVEETLPPTPPPTPQPPTTPLPDPTLVTNVTFATENSTAPVVDPAPMLSGVSESQSLDYAILIIVGPLIVCIIVIAIMTCVALCVRRKKQRELQNETGDRWASSTYTMS